jgi:hypothetical protein
LKRKNIYNGSDIKLKEFSLSILGLKYKHKFPFPLPFSFDIINRLCRDIGKNQKNINTADTNSTDTNY